MGSKGGLTEDGAGARRKRWRVWLLELTVFVVVFFVIQFWQQRDVPAGPAPVTRGYLADGRAFNLTDWRARHPGRPVALHFWATWCPICRTEEGSITALTRDWPVITVAEQSGDPAQVKSYLKKEGLDWRALVDATGRISAAYGLHGVPAFVVIDRNGVIRSVSVGYTTELGMRIRLWWADRF